MAARIADIPFLRVPVGDDAHRWSTFPGERTLVVAARTLTSTIRVLEVLPALLRGDSRVTVVFAHDPTSAFGDGSLDLLHDSGCRVMPWGQLPHIAPDLILSASENIEVPEGNCPVLVLPHGIGFQKYVPDSRSPRSRLSGVVPDALLEAGRAWIALSHPEQERQLLASHPKTAGHTLLVGDPCLDELLVSADRRDDYRRVLGVADHRRLVLVSSTWGPTSLIGRDPQLPARLLAELPWDEYRVGLVLHPNVWSAHGAWHVRTLQADALDAGLLLMPPVHDWRPALVAADVVIGDHGSVTLYGAALDKPLALAAYGNDAVPGTAGADLARTAPRFGSGRSALRQIEDVIRTHEPDRYASVAARAFTEPGTALARLRTALYDLLRLQPPTTAPPPAPLTLTVPENPATTVTAWMVVTRVTAPGPADTAPTPTATDAGSADIAPGANRISPTPTATDPEPTHINPAPTPTNPAPVSRAAAPVSRTTVDVRRFPCTVAAELSEEAGTFVHLAVCPDRERDRRLTESASVLLGSTSAPSSADGLRWVRDTLARWPGSLLAATALASGESLVGRRHGAATLVSAYSGPTDPAFAAAALYACLRDGRTPGEGPVTVRIGDPRDEPRGLPSVRLTLRAVGHLDG
ncbi:hypothetical protein [Streptomyces sp. NPDC051994]|uniref:hypothetical protein n=1 Tax=unclassified Streptomyces TaxID=2593676 RepID=UPI00341C239A